MDISSKTADYFDTIYCFIKRFARKKTSPIKTDTSIFTFLRNSVLQSQCDSSAYNLCLWSINRTIQSNVFYVLWFRFMVSWMALTTGRIFQLRKRFPSLRIRFKTIKKHEFKVFFSLLKSIPDSMNVSSGTLFYTNSFYFYIITKLKANQWLMLTVILIGMNPSTTD